MTGSSTVVSRMDGAATPPPLASPWTGMNVRALFVSLACVAGVAQTAHVLRAQTVDAFAEIDRAFDEYRLDAHVPGLVYGVVMDGRLVHVKGLGVQDLETNRPVTADTLFRIASMTKSFTALSILKLRDEGRLSLDAPAETYIPEMRGWRYPTEDSPRIRVRDLLTHTAGFVTDDPWGDRQTPLPEADFTRLLSDGVPFTRPPGTAMEYSNLGYAMLGRVVANVAQQPYKDYVAALPARPAGHGVVRLRGRAGAGRAPRAWLSLGGRGVAPRADDGARRVRRDGRAADERQRLREVRRLAAVGVAAARRRRHRPREAGHRCASSRKARTIPQLRQRLGKSGADACRQASTYGMGMIVAVDCDLGVTLSHGGGYPGYGSYVLLLPDYGVGIFAFANRTYAGPRAPVWDAAMALQKAGLLKARPAKVDDALASAYGAVATMYASGAVTSARRRARDELPARPLGRGLGPRAGEPEGAGRQLRDERADRRDRRALGRFHVALRARPAERLAAARADAPAADPVAEPRPRDALRGAGRVRWTIGRHDGHPADRLGGPESVHQS